MNFQQVVQSTVAGLIALLLSLAVLGITIYQVVNSEKINVPVELSSPWALVVGYFYGQHAAVNGARQAATSAAQAAATTAVAAAQLPPNE